MEVSFTQAANHNKPRPALDKVDDLCNDTFDLNKLRTQAAVVRCRDILKSIVDACMTNRIPSGRR